ncbi:23S rRNA pseudouridine1911/1915/1917 synthase [Rhodopirellula rubra]|uniref:23S rRNA pseudouridine1911/1915/1917 synthase n=1 Tax=Aporhodopirellula rubra TaxID=980271 RepID=A0A7W5E2P6_9BACT|nr:RluA family pseudouridine synthase [Aporhodopirellula rubra]MBB3208639.1 23S rRNA pseudouridine1911/1915/1917 synthase [Aporhodopirellula rubra]
MMKTIRFDTLPGCQPYVNERTMRVRESQSGMRLIDFLCEYHPPTRKEQWLAWIDAGEIMLDAVPLTADHRVRVGGRYVHAMHGFVEPEVNANIGVISEDESLLVIDKPAPLPVHPSGRFNLNTLSKLLESVYPDEKLRIAHRLDANTTGVVVFSRTSRAAGIVQPQFEKRLVKKEYLVRVRGHVRWEDHRCELRIGHARWVDQSAENGTGGARITHDSGLPAETLFRCIERFDDETSLLMASPITGRTNQIRVHAAALDHPVLGDPFYPRPADAASSSETITQTLRVDQPPMCLHAWRLTLTHPDTETEVRYESPPPDWAVMPGAFSGKVEPTRDS